MDNIPQCAPISYYTEFYLKGNTHIIVSLKEQLENKQTNK